MRNITPASKPLTEPVLLILLSLAEKPKHGYSLMKDIESLSDGRVRLGTGTLYGALRRLLPAGRRQLYEELERLKQLSRAATTLHKPKEV